MSPQESEKSNDPKSNTTLHWRSRLVLAKANFQPIKRTKTGQVQSRKYQYAALDDVLEAIMPALYEQALDIDHKLTWVGDQLFLETSLIDLTSGHPELVSSYPIAHDQGSQAMGRDMTYGRRYNISAMLNLVTEEDMDGAGAGAKKKSSKVSAKAKEEAPASIGSTRAEKPASEKSRKMLYALCAEAVGGNHAGEFMRLITWKFFYKGMQLSEVSTKDMGQKAVSTLIDFMKGKIGGANGKDAAVAEFMRIDRGEGAA